MPIFLSCFSAGSAGSSPTSSQNATLPSSSAWPLSASGYSSSFSSIASAPSIAGTAFLLPQLLHSQEKALESALPVLAGALPQAEVYLEPCARWQLSCQPCGGEWWIGVPGIVLRKNGFIPLAATQCWHRDLWGRNTVQGLSRNRPFQEELM